MQDSFQKLPDLGGKQTNTQKKNFEDCFTDELPCQLPQ